jgi:hypothetical protein
MAAAMRCVGDLDIGLSDEMMFPVAATETRAADLKLVANVAVGQGTSRVRRRLVIGGMAA